ALQQLTCCWARTRITSSVTNSRSDERPSRPYNSLHVAGPERESLILYY
ncbi:Uncharacterized protein APZ42_008783, partial [Daphnia magna]